MFGEILLSLALISDCPDFLRDFADESQGQRGILPVEIEELSRTIRIPSQIDGLVAELFHGKHLKAYGIVNAAHNGFERIEFWGFSQSPQKLFTIHEAGKIEKHVINKVLVAALVEAPNLEKLLASKGAFLGSLIQQHWKLNVLVHQEKDQERDLVEETPTWDEVFRSIYEERLGREFRIEASRGRTQIIDFTKDIHQVAAVPEPPSRESRTITFGGWLPEKHSATVIMQQVPHGSELTLKVFLHPKLKNHFDPAFPDLERRIRLERRFELSWLRLPHFTMVETDETVIREGRVDRDIPTLISGNLVMVFEDGAAMPEGVSYYHLDPTTGLRTSGPQMRALSAKVK